jgi:SP family myo-inositol transporter-like MFS transporter 13
MIIPVYIGEASPSPMRGALITVYQMMIASGFVLANACAAGFAHIDPDNVGWRLMFAFAAIPASIQLVGFFFLPETPRWLMTHNEATKAEAVLHRVYNGNREWIEYEMNEIRQAQQHEAKQLTEHGNAILCC